MNAKKPVPPVSLYRYFRIRDDTLRSLAESKLWFSNLSGYNDPFEGAVLPTIRGTPHDFRLLIDRALKREAAIIGAADAAHRREQKLRTLETVSSSSKTFEAFLDKLDNQFRESRSVLTNTAGILSLSERNDSILMWSHYAESHRGFCLEMNVHEDDRYSPFCYPVRYQANYPLFDHFSTSSEERLQLMLLTKAKEWSYEKEWRILSTERFGLKSFRSSLVKGLIIGHRMTLEDRNKLQIAVSSLRIPVFECRPLDRKFGMQLHPLSR